MSHDTVILETEPRFDFSQTQTMAATPDPVKSFGELVGQQEIRRTGDTVFPFERDAQFQ